MQTRNTKDIARKGGLIYQRYCQEGGANLPQGGSFTTPAYLHLRHNSIFRLHHIGTVVNLISQIKKQQPQKNV